MTKKAIYLLAGILAVYAALAATHKGEFWPFSIYPMFSGGGQPWNDALIRKINEDTRQIKWNITTKKELPGSPFSLNKRGISQQVLYSFNAASHWNEDDTRRLRSGFQNKFNDGEAYLIVEAHGQIIEKGEDSVAVSYIPMVLMRKDTILFNPHYFHYFTDKEGL
jgi:hypothetical protein